MCKFFCSKQNWEFSKSVIEREKKQMEIWHVQNEEKRKHGYVRIIYFSLMNQNYESYKL